MMIARDQRLCARDSPPTVSGDQELASGIEKALMRSLCVRSADGLLKRGSATSVISDRRHLQSIGLAGHDEPDYSADGIG